MSTVHHWPLALCQAELLRAARVAWQPSPGGRGVLHGGELQLGAARAPERPLLLLLLSLPPWTPGSASPSASAPPRCPFPASGLRSDLFLPWKV